MIQLSGISKNIDTPLIGKISFSSVLKKGRHNTIYINPELSYRKLKDYLAVISSVENINIPNLEHLPIIYNTRDISSLDNGDVVELLPNGLINVLYQINSKDNILFLTQRCNQNCLMCPQPLENKEDNLFETNLKLIQLIDKSTEEIAITGGEPTVVGENLFKIILACKHFLPNTTLLLLTNGMKFSDYKYTHIFSSIKHPKIIIAVSLQSDNPIDHDYIVGREGAFSQTVKGIINLASFGNIIEIRIVIQRYNYQRLQSIADYIYRNMTFVEHINFMGLETIGYALKNLKLLWVEPEDICKPLEEAVHYLVQRHMKVSVYNIPLCLIPKRLWGYARQSISAWKNVFDSKCEVCSMREKCSGLFESGIDIYSKYLKTL